MDQKDVDAWHKYMKSIGLKDKNDEKYKENLEAAAKWMEKYGLKVTHTPKPERFRRKKPLMMDELRLKQSVAKFLSSVPVDEWSDKQE